MPMPPTRVHRILLLILAAVIFGLCLWRAGAAPIIEGLPFKDSDDIMRVLQVQRWLQTGAWYDLTQPRLNPPAGVEMHWSRLPDLPLAGLIWLSEPLLGAERAALLAAHLVPALLGVAFFAAFVWAARPFTGRSGLLFAGLVALGLSIPLADFAAGRVDHHGWQLLLATLSAGALLRLLALLGTPLRAPAPWLAVLAGVAGALGLWIGAEAIPPVAFGAALLALGWLRHGRRGAEQLTRYGLVLTTTTLVLIPLALAPGARAASTCDAFSWVSVALAAAVALFGLGALAAERWIVHSPRCSHLGHVQARVLLAVPLGLLLLGLLYAWIPHCAGGPYAGIAEPSAQLVERVSEAQPLLKALRERPANAGSFVVLPLLALLISAWRSRVSPPRARTRWLGLSLLIGGGLLLMGWQLRGAALANLYAGLALAWWAAAVGARIGETRRLLPRLLRRAGPAVVVALLPLAVTLAVTKLSDASADETDASEATTASTDDTCDLNRIAAQLNQPPWTTRAPLLIAAPVNLGAPLLWLTPHHVLAAPYHRNDAGIEAGTQIFFRDAETARKAIARRRVDVLLVCPHDPVASHERRDGVELFYDQLREGETPDWLIEIPLADAATATTATTPSRLLRQSPGLKSK